MVSSLPILAKNNGYYNNNKNKNKNKNKNTETKVRDADKEVAYARFSVPAPLPRTSLGADDALLFELATQPTNDIHRLSFSLNGRAFEFNTSWSNDRGPTTGTLDVKSDSATVGTRHSIQYTLQVGLGNQPSSRSIFFEANTSTSATKDKLAFSVSLNVTDTAALALLSITVHPSSSAPGVAFDFVQDTRTVLDTKKGLVDPGDMKTALVTEKHVSFDLSHEFHALHLLEAEAEELKATITAKKNEITQHLREQRDRASLRQMIEECDGLLCAARVVAQRICDRIDVMTDRGTGYALMQDSQPHQHAGSLHGGAETLPQRARNCTKSKRPGMFRSRPSNGTAQGMSMPVVMTKNGTDSHYNFENLEDATNPLMRALAVIATLLGIIALVRFIRRRCMSMRSRVERAADREERRNARAYRKAARRADMRRRWDAFTRHLRREPAPRITDYNEKRALILQDAFLEHLDDLDQAERGEIMEAEIRELRHAHEIVASLVHVSNNRYACPTPLLDDLPPSRLSLPSTSEPRSRASTQTLPSYTSESPPDYTSRPDTLAASHLSDSLVHGFPAYPPSVGMAEDRQVPSVTSSGRSPVSSVPDIEYRASEDTLRTGRSREV
ncbi:hypothetical protein LTR62_006842 [Meristemomyces frigidus]|uniref:Uncharacterized protein n=1 Tax=Meristemomyces frigidus TaxID=1508187 RepID=A0AAN7TN05_9PEZI|nr:hypothetical protein LTR62_006842 [Meristemomyces frigidus]